MDQSTGLRPTTDWRWWWWLIKPSLYPVYILITGNLLLSWLPWPGIQPGPPRWQSSALTTRPPVYRYSWTHYCHTYRAGTNWSWNLTGNVRRRNSTQTRSSVPNVLEWTFRHGGDVLLHSSIQTDLFLYCTGWAKKSKPGNFCNNYLSTASQFS